MEFVTIADFVYNCDTRTPCFKENMDAHGYYYEQPDQQEYIQCDNFGKCHPQECQGTLVWNQAIHTCYYPE